MVAGNKVYIIQSLVSKGRLQDATDLLTETIRVNRPELLNKVIAISSTLSDVKNAVIIGILDFEEEQKQRKSIVYRLLLLVDEFNTYELD